MRKSKINRTTSETNISVEINLDGKGKFKISTGVGFLDHMLEQLSKHSLIDLEVNAKGDTHIDLHHTTEDTGIAIGEAIKKAAGNRKGITRYASTMIPMDETLSRVSIDLFKIARPKDYNVNAAITDFDGDTIYLNGQKIRFSGIDTPEIKQVCKKNNEVIKCGIRAKELLINKIGKNKVNCLL